MPARRRRAPRSVDQSSKRDGRRVCRRRQLEVQCVRTARRHRTSTKGNRQQEAWLRRSASPIWLVWRGGTILPILGEVLIAPWIQDRQRPVDRRLSLHLCSSSALLAIPHIPTKFPSSPLSPSTMHACGTLFTGSHLAGRSSTRTSVRLFDQRGGERCPAEHGYWNQASPGIVHGYRRGAAVSFTQHARGRWRQGLVGRAARQQPRASRG